MATGLISAGCLRAPTPMVGLASSRVLVRLSSVHVIGQGRRAWNPQLRGRHSLGRTRDGHGVMVVKAFLPADPWAPGNAIDSQSIASSLFAASLFPYLGFLYHITKSKTAPPLTLFGFYFLLAFVGATIPAGIYAKLQYGTSLSNVDWLHGGAESLLTLTNLFIVFGLRGALRKEKEESSAVEVEQEEKLPLSK
ncbi:unnamed protein product [Calypogeia fissa]